jgi:hypothetical protein
MSTAGIISIYNIPYAFTGSEILGSPESKVKKTKITLNGEL